MKINKLALSIGLALCSVSNAALASEFMADDAMYEDIDTVVITGQKIDRTIKETPTSVAVITAEDLDKQNAQNVSDVFSGMANVTGDLMQGFTIRGTSAFNVSGGGNSYLATMYVDGAPLPMRVIRSGAVPVWDLAQVEVFRGPQSTLQGRNALAGAIHIRTQDPTYEWGGKAKATFGTDGQQEFAIAGGGGLIEDMLAFRVSIEDKTYDGDIDNVTRKTKSNFEDATSARAKFLFQPNDDFTAILTLSNLESELGVQWATYRYGESVFKRETDFNSPVWTKTDTDIATLEMSYAITDELSLDAVITTNDSDYAYNWDGDMTSEQLVADQKYTRNDKTNSQELRLTYDGEDVEAVVGLYFSDLDVSDYSQGERHLSLADAVGADFNTLLVGFLMQNAGLDQATAVTTAGQVAPLYPNIDPVVLGLNTSLAQKVKTKALFADIKYTLTDSFDILAGFRLDNEEQTNASNADYKILNNKPDPTAVPAQISPIVGGVNAFLDSFAEDASGVEPPSSEDFDAFLPKLGVSYHYNSNITTSFIYQQGYRSGGVGTNVAENRIFTYDEEVTDNYEFSYRSVWLQGDLMVNANVFFTEWTDQQVRTQLSSRQYDVETKNAGESEIKGFELEGFYYPTKNLSITAGVGYADSEFTDYKYPNPKQDPAVEGDEFRDLTGRSFADASTWTANVSVDYEFDSGLFMNVNANYSDESTAYLDPKNSLSAEVFAINPDPKNDARTIVNAQVGYDFGSYQLRLDARNLLDEDYISAYFSDALNNDSSDAYGQAQVGRSRQISLSIVAEF